jgi:hypothetical protein
MGSTGVSAIRAAVLNGLSRLNFASQVSVDARLRSGSAIVSDDVLQTL